MTFRFGPNGSRPFANPRGIGPQFRIANHFFHVTQPIGPFAETLAGEGARLFLGIAFVRTGEATELLVLISRALVLLTTARLPRLVRLLLTGLLPAGLLRRLTLPRLLVHR